MGGSSDSNKDVTKTRRYAPYIEEHHSDFLGITVARRVIMINDSPFADYSPVETSDAFFGLGYLISSFPSLYDMFGKRMVGLDIETIWNSAFGKIVNDPNINVNILEDMKLIDDGIIKGELADFQVNMRNLNAVATSSFVVGKAVTEDKRIKTLAKMSLETKGELLSGIGKEYAVHLNWEKVTITVYAKAMKDYFMYTSMMDDVNTNFASRDSLWPFTVLSFEGAALGTMQSVFAWRKQMTRARSGISTVLSIASDTVTGAVVGFAVGGYIGAIVGAVIGIIVGIARMLLE
ncbi:MAG: hypothetical protein IMZ53_06925 [Thermoplasmata archaeon]|nr:hypothetical protein [Thermoplasmata archaeon]